MIQGTESLEQIRRLENKITSGKLQEELQDENTEEDVYTDK